MLNTILNKENAILMLQPHGALKKEDFEHAAEVIDMYLKEKGKVNGIIIYTKSFPGWEDFAAFSSHLKFIKDHHKEINKIAFVTDSVIGNIADKITSHFVSAEIKNFDFNDKDKAMDWIMGD
ncbi:Conserved protein [hydrothermal vent metagenome]|uniref:Conserved protein n=1 Tax=hydrothermal vent metagenome TaxID=652676 RepID=A0A1W1EDG1_9ZZZZ